MLFIRNLLSHFSQILIFVIIMRFQLTLSTLLIEILRYSSDAESNKVFNFYLNLKSLKPIFAKTDRHTILQTRIKDI